jgi:hypothetical protein
MLLRQRFRYTSPVISDNDRLAEDSQEQGPVCRVLLVSVSLSFESRIYQPKKGGGVRSIPSVGIEATEQQSEALADGLVRALGREEGRNKKGADENLT